MRFPWFRGFRFFHSWTSRRHPPRAATTRQHGWIARDLSRRPRKATIGFNRAVREMDWIEATIAFNRAVRGMEWIAVSLEMVEYVSSRLRLTELTAIQLFTTCPLLVRRLNSARGTLAAAPRPAIGPNQSCPRAHYSLAKEDCMHVSMQYEYIYCNFEDLYMYLQLPTFFALSSCN